MNSNFGKHLALYRNRSGLTVREMGEIMNISFSLISKYENNKRKPSLAFLYRLQSRFNISPNDFEYLKQSQLGKNPTRTFSSIRGVGVEWVLQSSQNSTDYIVGGGDYNG